MATTIDADRLKEAVNCLHPTCPHQGDSPACTLDYYRLDTGETVRPEAVPSQAGMVTLLCADCRKRVKDLDGIPACGVSQTAPLWVWPGR